MEFSAFDVYRGVLWACIVLGGLVVARAIFRTRRNHEERKTQEAFAREWAKKQRFDSFMKAQSESRERITRRSA